MPSAGSNGGNQGTQISDRSLALGPCEPVLLYQVSLYEQSLAKVFLVNRCYGR